MFDINKFKADELKYLDTRVNYTFVEKVESQLINSESDLEDYMAVLEQSFRDEVYEDIGDAVDALSDKEIFDFIVSYVSKDKAAKLIDECVLNDIELTFGDIERYVSGEAAVDDKISIIMSDMLLA